MKRRILCILLTLCMVLCLAPAVAFAEEGETPVTDIDVIIGNPVAGKNPATQPLFTATPADSVDFVSASWKRIPQEKFNNDSAAAEDWEALTTTDTFETGYYYSVELRFSPKPGYTFSEQLTGTINGTPAIVQPQEAGVVLRVIIGTLANTPVSSVTSVNAQITEPVLGATPDRSPVITADPANSMTLNSIHWRKVKSEDVDQVDWTDMDDMQSIEVFEAGYVYYLIIYLDTQANYQVADNTVGTINGESCRDVNNGGNNRVTLMRAFILKHEAHVAGTNWVYDETQHWNLCAFGDGTKLNIADHVSSDWIIDLPATAETTGTKIKKCTVCGKEMERAEIPTTRADWTSVWSEGFETSTNEALPVGWTAEDKDGDGHGWTTDMSTFTITDSRPAHHGARFIYSHSFKNYTGALTPDNWLYLPPQQLNAGQDYQLTFMAAAQDMEYYADVFGVYISTDNGLNYTQLGDDYTITKPGQGWLEDGFDTWEEITVDLSRYAGKTVNLAIVHHNCTNQFILKLDCFNLWSKAHVHTPEDDDYNCTTALHCSTCGAELIPAQAEHRYSDQWVANRPGSSHIRACQNEGCRAVLSQNCTGDGTQTCQSLAKCTVCGGDCGALADHDFSAEKAEPEYLETAATCTESAVYYKSCSVCGLAAAEDTFTSGDPLGHDFGAWASNGDGTHTRTCSYDETHTQSGACIGGTADCHTRAICVTCGESYGAVDAAHHSNLKHTAATAASTEAAGSIEYWYCPDCNKYFSDAAATREIEKTATVTDKRTEEKPTAPKTEDSAKSPKTGDNAPVVAWLTLLLVSGGAAVGTAIVRRKRAHSK